MAGVLEICAELPERTFAPGEILVREGVPSSHEIYILASGALEVVKDGDVSISTLTDPGAVVGEMSLLLGVPHTASVRALEPSRCLVAADGNAFLRENPAFVLAVARLLARRLMLATTYLADIKRQYEGADASLAMLDQVLETFLHHPHDDDCEPGSDREREPNL